MKTCVYNRQSGQRAMSIPMIGMHRGWSLASRVSRRCSIRFLAYETKAWLDGPEVSR
jgi:hypothetical protein